ncbi:T9SS type A sorting domain-containing protein [Flammeovirga pectinis]|uniref:T9SS type A sorting domain-containing protein n=1 Tax=Flammeovirga pectinis TaxID=2494373 RepID=A0A3S9PB14_9BACT|nr:leucine-rich repeat protein [Flammeovirga pectinis]AZQ65406.1 T9SS type A sorting domain-containing protein [Flammeovirga pectinis]
MKKLLNLIFVFVITTSTVFSQYTLTDSDVVVTSGRLVSCSYSFSDTDIIIPSTLDNQTVTIIGTSAFENKGITSVKLPSTLTDFEVACFRNNALTSIVIPNSVTRIENFIFEDNNINSITFPSTLKEIGNQAFYDNQLTTVSIPNTVTSISPNAFGNNSSLSSVTLPTHPNSLYSYTWAEVNNPTNTNVTSFTDFTKGFSATINFNGIRVTGLVNGEDNIAIAVTGDLSSSTTYNNGDTYTVEVPVGSDIVITPSKTGKVFTPTSYSYTNLTANKSAQDFQQYYTITYHNTYGVANTNNTTFNPIHNNVTIPITDLAYDSRNGYTFGGWYTESTFTNSKTQFTNADRTDISLYAKWILIDYRISYENLPSNVTNPNPSTYTIESPDIILQELATTAFYTFYGWYHDGFFKNLVGEGVVAIPNGSTGFVEFTLDFCYNITINYENVFNATNPNPAYFHCKSDAITLQNLVRENYSFLGWYSDAELTQPVIGEAVEANPTNLAIRTYYAKWSEEGVTSLEDRLQNLINVYPNPVNDQLTLDLSSLKEKVTLNIYTIDNKLLKTIDLHKTNQIPFNYTKGIYLIEIINQKTSIIKKIIKN